MRSRVNRKFERIILIGKVIVIKIGWIKVFKNLKIVEEISVILKLLIFIFVGNLEIINKLIVVIN